MTATVGNIQFAPRDVIPRNWDSVSRRYVEHDTLPQETFGVIQQDLSDGKITINDARRAVGLAPFPSNDNNCVEAAPRHEKAPNMGLPLTASTTPRADRKAAYVVTYTGRFYPFAPSPEDVRIADIAHGLAHSARYNGAGRRFYSTAEHSHHIALWLLPRYGAEVALCGLLHDAPEPLSGFGDVLRPVKDTVPFIKETETNIWLKAVAPAFGLPLDMPLAVHEADSRIIADEMRQNLMEVDPGYRDPLGIALNFWSPEVAEVWFLSTFKTLVEAVKAEKMRVDW